MPQAQKVLKNSLEQQLDWTKGQIHLLDEMDVKLNEMKKIAEYAAEKNFSSTEIEKLNDYKLNSVSLKLNDILSSVKSWLLIDEKTPY